MATAEPNAGNLVTIIPKCFKYLRKKNTSKSTEKKDYSKSYITFLDLAIKASMVKEYQQKDDFISIIFSDNFMNGLSEPPYIKLPFDLLSDVSTNNYRFLIYFIDKLFSYNPNNPYFVNIKIRELLKITGISLSTSNNKAVQRLNNYLSILEKYHVISNPLFYIANDIRRNTLITLRLHPFKHSSNFNDEDEEYDEEET